MSKVAMLRALESLLPTIFNTPLVHIDTFATHQQRPYEADCKWFAEHPGRRMYIRGAFDDEFDSDLAFDEFMKQPQHQAWVTKERNGFHRVEFVFMGRMFTKEETRTDDDVLDIILRMKQLLGGYGGPECIAYLKPIVEQMNSKALAASTNSNKSVN